MAEKGMLGERSIEADSTLRLFLYGTGARINETLCLKSNHVDLEHGTVAFTQLITNKTRVIPLG
jgi:site-specific recombinase XerD